MPTADSGSSAYAAVEDFTTRFDKRTIQELSSDLETRTPAGQLELNARILAGLQDASGIIESAVSVGRQYKPEDLAALSGNGLSYLKRLVCELAVGLIIEARPSARMEVPRCYDRALETLDLLRKGERVLGLLEQRQAGYLSDHLETPREVEDRDGIVVEAQRFFSRRNNRLVKLP